MKLFNLSTLFALLDIMEDTLSKYFSVNIEFYVFFLLKYKFILIKIVNLEPSIVSAFSQANWVLCLFTIIENSPVNWSYIINMRTYLLFIALILIVDNWCNYFRSLHELDIYQTVLTHTLFAFLGSPTRVIDKL